MDKKIIKEPGKKAPAEVPFRKIPEVQQTEYRFDEASTEKQPGMTPENSFTVPSHTDVLGSYTGQPENKYEQPVQDADDL